MSTLEGRHTDLQFNKFVERKYEMKPAVPVPSATIVLTRKHQGEFQVYLLRRNKKSRFMGGYYVFPGGIVDDEDLDCRVWEARSDLGPEETLKRFGGNFSEIKPLGFCVAAIRETMEEAGILLAHGEKSIKDELEKIRALSASGNLSQGWFIERAVSLGWILEFSALSRWSHWITPELMKHRYNTRFFLATIPPGQECRPDTRETSDGLWISAEKGLAGNMKGEIPLSPPTLVTLHDLLKYPTFEALAKETKKHKRGEIIMPRLVPLEKTSVILEPWDPEYDSEKVEINQDRLPGAVLPVREPFSRLWCSKGIWKPISR